MRYSHPFSSREEILTEDITMKGFICDQEIPQTHPRAGTFLHGPNQWPTALCTRDFEGPLLEYRAQVVKVVETLLHAFATTLSDHLPENAFDGFTTGVTAPLRLLHYPPQVSDDKRQFGSKRLHNSAGTVVQH